LEHQTVISRASPSARQIALGNAPTMRSRSAKIAPFRVELIDRVFEKPFVVHALVPVAAVMNPRCLEWSSQCDERSYSAWRAATD
jgi:hypothetical protein